MGVVMETETPGAAPMPDTSPPEEQPEPNEADLPDKPVVEPPLHPDDVPMIPGEEPVPDEDFQSPEEAEGDPESDNTEQVARYDGGAIPR